MKRLKISFLFIYFASFLLFFFFFFPVAAGLTAVGEQLSKAEAPGSWLFPSQLHKTAIYTYTSMKSKALLFRKKNISQKKNKLNLANLFFLKKKKRVLPYFHFSY